MDSLMITNSGGGGQLRSKLRSAASAICMRATKHQNHHTYPKISASNYPHHHHHHHHQQQQQQQQSMQQVHARHRPALGILTKAPGTLHKSGSFSGRNGKSPSSSMRSANKDLMEALASSDVLAKKQSAPEVAVVKSTSAAVRLNGKISREALAAWSGRVGSPCHRAPADTVQPLFNDLHLYPSKTLVFEMMACARRCASRGEFSLSFGEFCIFAVELRRRARCRNLSSKSKETNATSPNSELSEENLTASKSATDSSENGKKSEPPPFEVFLGGSCNPTTWRSDIAIPTLDEMGITYYNPQVKNWTLDLIDKEHRAKESARVLFFVLDAETRAAAAAIEVAHLAASIKSRHLVLVLQPYRRGQQIAGELVPDQEYLDLSRGQAILQEVAERRELPVFNELQAALKCTQLLLRGGELSTSQSFPGNSPPAPAISKHIMKLKNAFDAADEKKTGSLTLNETISAIKSFSGVSVSIKTLEGIIAAHGATKSKTSVLCRSSSSLHFNSHMSNNETRSNLVDYEAFCTVMAEISADSGCSDDFTVSTTNLTDLEKRLKVLVGKESGTLDAISPCSACDLINDVDEQKCQNFQQHQKQNDPCNSEAIGTGKWRQMFHCVQAAILNFISRIEINSMPFSTQKSNCQEQKFPKNGSNSLSKSSSGSSVTYARRKEQDEHVKSKYQESVDINLDDDNYSNIEKQSNSSSNSNGKQPGRKLSVFIPKPIVDENSSSGSTDNPGSAVLTPQSSRRLDGLAESLRDEVAMRDVYLGGSSAGRSNWREETVVPILETHNLTYYKPSMNDYNRMFSAPPYTPASGTMFTFDGLSSGKSNSKMHSVMEDDSANSSNHIMTDRDSKLRIISSSDNAGAESGRSIHKHERSPITGSHPEKKPKLSSDESPIITQDDEDIELRSKGVSANGYSLQQASSSNRLSASDFYKISDNASPAPFRGMYDERQLWRSRVLFFGVTSDTRCLTPMVLASHCIGLRPRSVVLCVQLINKTDGLTELAVKDYNRGRMYLTDLAKRVGVPVFDNLEEAIQCVVRKLETRDY